MTLNHLNFNFYYWLDKRFENVTGKNPPQFYSNNVKEKKFKVKYHKQDQCQFHEKMLYHV